MTADRIGERVKARKAVAAELPDGTRRWLPMDYTEGTLMKWLDDGTVYLTAVSQGMERVVRCMGDDMEFLK